MVCCEGEGNSFYIKIRFSDEDAVSSDIINRFFLSGLVALPRFGSNYSISQLVSLSLALIRAERASLVRSLVQNGPA